MRGAALFGCGATEKQVDTKNEKREKADQGGQYTRTEKEKKKRRATSWPTDLLVRSPISPSPNGQKIQPD